MSQERTPLPPQTAHKAWAAAAGAIVANLAVWVAAAFARWMTGAELTIDPEMLGEVATVATAFASALGAWLGAYVKRNWLADGGAQISCHPVAVVAAAALVLALAGCATSPDRAAALSQQMRTVALAQIAAWNAAGVDPLQMDERQLLYASTACLSLTAVTAVVASADPGMPEEIAGWCAAAVAAAAPASGLAPGIAGAPPVKP